jgi:glycosyltransferase involved in cell wall biosynthesis
MKILHINQSDTNGGAAIAGYRLHQGLLTTGHDSKILAGYIKTKSDRVAEIPRNKTLERNLLRFTCRAGLSYLANINSFDIPKHPFFQSADVLNLHNLHTGYFNYLAISKLTQLKPAVFTLHDMWSFTGHCAYSNQCDRWKIGCGKCPDLDTYPSMVRDSSDIEWKLKNRTYAKSNLTIVAPSHWLADQAKSSMLSRFPVHHIPNGIDMSVFQALDRQQCRHALGLPQDKKILLFAAASISDTRKGGDLLWKALAALPNDIKQNVLLLILGADDSEIPDIGVPAIQMGYVESDRIKATIYSAADLFVFPTRADNLPLVLQESMACGTPMVSFDIGGVPDLVRPGTTGYLAAPEDALDLRDGIVKLLNDENLRSHMRTQCRSIALAEYSIELQVQRYTGLYEQALKESSAHRPRPSSASAI